MCLVLVVEEQCLVILLGLLYGLVDKEHALIVFKKCFLQAEILCSHLYEL